MGRWKREVNRAGEGALGQVVTVSEACDLWGYHDTTIRNALLMRQLCYRQTKQGIILISVASMLKNYGNPLKYF